jgi:ABC-type multidrug transport system permease subunit
MGGKLAAGAGFMAAISLVALLAVVPMTGAPWLSLPGALVWCTFSGTTLLCVFVILQFLASTARGANIVTTMVLFPLMMIGGSFFPLELMPRWMAAIGRFTPNGQGVVQLRAILGGTADATSLALAVVAMGLPSLVFFFLSVRLVRGRFAAGA